ncbi:MAG: bifunctional phosphoribosylaminoimidazolecarboxamide formyltransferase/IMP cyclohydrolase [Coriobacteriales bacterium]|jgi:phosphoribosylaminoimidazolecarboxamide formyltransferase/IMP cyclohydrolase
MDNPVIKRALVSVTDKSGVVEFARALHDEFGVEIVSTGGTARVIAEAGIDVKPIEELTGFPEMMDGRVKTLHPVVHGGLLARRDLESHMAAAAEHGIGMIDMVVVNLYAFEATVAKPDATYADCIENIDIGGPSMLRSAAKNHASVAVVTDPASYDDILAEMRANGGATTLETRQRLALRVYETTSAYDNAIYNWLNAQLNGDTSFADDKRVFLNKAQELRYGENSHQKAAFYRTVDDPALAAEGVKREWMLASAEQLQGKELSYNNFLDLDACWGCVREFAEPTCVIVKHQTPCGIATADNLVDAYQRAWACDTVSAFGGVMAFNGVVTEGVIKAVLDNGQFIEAVIAPDFEQGALDLLASKPNARVLRTGGCNPAGHGFEMRTVEGGVLVQEYDSVSEDPATFTVASERKPTDAEFDELLFAWKTCRAIKSNAIVITNGKTTLGMGAGQPNRVNSARFAAEQAGEKAKGAVAASDAFMPFADSLEVLIEAGVTAVIQPGGSIRDGEVIEAANKAGIALVFTGHRHFRH